MWFALGLRCAGFSAGPGGPLIVQNAAESPDDIVSILHGPLRLYIDKACEPLVPGLPSWCIQLAFIDGSIVGGLI